MKLLLLYIPFIIISFLACRYIYKTDNFKNNKSALLALICCFIPIVNIILCIISLIFFIQNDFIDIDISKNMLNRIFIIKGEKDVEKKFKGKGYS